MKKNIITNKITPCCGLPFSIIYWWVSNLNLNSESDRKFILSKIYQNGTISIDGWKVLINSGTLEADASLTKAEFLKFFDCGRQPTCEQLKLIIEGYKVGNWTPETELPSNLATVDKIVNGLTYVGNAYDKAQTDAKISTAKNEMMSGIKGVATTSTVPSATGFERYLVHTAGTYTNFGGITVTAADLDVVNGVANNRVILEVNNGVSTKIVERVKGDTGSTEIPNYNPALSYVQKSTVVKNGAIWRVVDGQIANVGEEPEVSSKWVNLSFNKEFFEFGTDEEVYIPFALTWANQSYRNLNTGNISTAEPNFRRSNMIDLNGRRKLKLNASFGAISGLAGFDANGNLVFKGNAATMGTAENVFTSNLIYTLPSNVEKIELSSQIAEVNTSIGSLIEGSNVYTLQEFKESFVDPIESLTESLKDENGNPLDFTGGYKTNYIIKDNTVLTTVTGKYIGCNGVEQSNETTSYKKVSLKKGVSIWFSNKSIVEAPCYVFKGKNSNRYGPNFSVTTDIVDSFYANEDGDFYINLNNTFLSVELNLFSFEEVKFNNIKDYVDFQNSEIVDGDFETVNLKILYNDFYFGLSNPVGADWKNVGQQSGYNSSEIFPVFAGEKLLVTGYFGTLNGVALFDENGKYVKKLMSGAAAEMKDAEITIPQDGFITVSSYVGYPAKVKYFKKEVVEKSASEDVGIKAETIFVTEKPKFARINLYGELPTDASPTRLPTTLNFDFLIGKRKVFSAKCELSIQGNASATYEKKGYTFDILNLDGKSLKIKFGDLIASDSLHLKAYQTDRTHTRDLGMGRAWREIINSNGYPVSEVNNKPYSITSSEANELFISDAKYRPEGFPVEIYLNDAFHGLYTLRLKKTRENYALDNKNLNHIFLDNIDYNATLIAGFNPAKWELKSPKMTRYVEGGTIPTVSVNDSVQRFFNWMKDFKNNTGTARADYGNYIVLENWIDYLIFIEVFDHRDSNGNNINLITWNNTHWVWCPYDMDNSIGLNPFNNAWTIDSSRNGFCSADFFVSFRSYFLPQIKLRYAELKANKILTVQNLGKYFDDIEAFIPRDVANADKNKWVNKFTNGYPTIQQIKLFLKNRLEWLDTQWLNP